MGSGIACHMVAEVDKDSGGSSSPVSGLVLEAPFNSMYNEVGHDRIFNHKVIMKILKYQCSLFEEEKKLLLHLNFGCFDGLYMRSLMTA